MTFIAKIIECAIYILFNAYLSLPFIVPDKAFTKDILAS